MVNALAVVGTGLIGASVGARRPAGGRRPRHRLGPDADTLAVAARARGARAGGARSPTHFAGPTLALVAVPVVELPDVVREVLAPRPRAAR